MASFFCSKLKGCGFDGEAIAAQRAAMQLIVTKSELGDGGSGKANKQTNKKTPLNPSNPQLKTTE